MSCWLMFSLLPCRSFSEERPHSQLVLSLHSCRWLVFISPFINVLHSLHEHNIYLSPSSWATFDLKNLSKMIESSLTMTLASLHTTLHVARFIPKTRSGSRFLKRSLTWSSLIASHSPAHSNHIGLGNTVREDWSKEFKCFSLICVDCY